MDLEKIQVTLAAATANAELLQTRAHLTPQDRIYVDGSIAYFEDLAAFASEAYRILFDIASHGNCTCILVGDDNQHAEGCVVGRAIRLLEYP